MVPEQPVTFSLHVCPTESVAFFLLIFADAAVASSVCIREAANENVITPAVRARFIFLFIVMFLSFVWITANAADLRRLYPSAQTV